MGIVERLSGILVFKSLGRFEHPSVQGRLTFILLYTGHLSLFHCETPWGEDLTKAEFSKSGF